MARPKAEFKNVKFLITLPPLMKARLDAQVKYESKRQQKEVPVAVLVRAALEKYFKENPLPDGYFNEHLERIKDETERTKLFKQQQLILDFQKDNIIYKP